ncbi:MAG: hypothetical protein ACRDZY_08035 [Acidimicrobiales bacterium]
MNGYRVTVLFSVEAASAEQARAVVYVRERHAPGGVAWEIAEVTLEDGAWAERRTGPSTRRERLGDGSHLRRHNHGRRGYDVGGAARP